MKKATRLTISGSVQGVFFRQFVQDNATKRDVRGFVRNLENGHVEIFLEGDAEPVDSLIALCQRGPQHSQIRNVEIKDEKFQGFKDFKILKF